MQSAFVAIQLRKSFFLITATICIFFCVYLIQAFQFYKHVGQSELAINHTNNVLRQLTSVQTGVHDMDLALQAYLLTPSKVYEEALSAKADSAIEKVGHIETIAQGEHELYTHAVALKELLIKKKTINLQLIFQIQKRKNKIIGY